MRELFLTDTYTSLKYLIDTYLILLSTNWYIVNIISKCVSSITSL